MKTYKLAIYGDSLSCPRQDIVKSHERYLALIENFIRSKKEIDYLEVRDKSIGGATLQTLYNQYHTDNFYFTLPGEVLILHSGIVDCAPRPINEKTRSRIGRLPEFMKKRVISYLHKNRAKLLLKNGGYIKTDIAKFSALLKDFLSHASENYNHIFVINICPTTREFEQHSPGFSANINRYNQCIDHIVSLYPKAVIVDVHGFVMDHFSEIEKYILETDGHHIHPITHRYIADQIIASIMSQAINVN